MWTGMMASHSLQAAVWLKNLVTDDCRDSCGLPLRLPLSGTGWALLWYLKLRAWPPTPAGSLTLLYRYTLFTSRMPRTHTHRLRGEKKYVFSKFLHKWKMMSKHKTFFFSVYLSETNHLSEFSKLN